MRIRKNPQSASSSANEWQPENATAGSSNESRQVAVGINAKNPERGCRNPIRLDNTVQLSGNGRKIGEKHHVTRNRIENSRLKILPRQRHRVSKSGRSNTPALTANQPGGELG